MEQEQFSALMPYIVTDLIAEICKIQNLSEEDAFKKLYFSKLYTVLENEETKVWHYSTQLLYRLLEQEEENGTIVFPDE